MYALNLSETDHRVLSVTFQEYAPAEAILVDTLPEGDIYEYRYENGEFIHDPLPTEEQVFAPTDGERIDALEAAVMMLCMPDISEV